MYSVTDMSLYYRCLEIQKDLICIWKLLGDSCALLSALPEKYCKLKVASWLWKDSIFVSENTVELDSLLILRLASRSFCQAIAINSNMPELWYDLAFVYCSMVKLSETEKIKKHVRNLACSSVKKSILLDDKRWESWSLYGIILASKGEFPFKLIMIVLLFGRSFS